MTINIRGTGIELTPAIKQYVEEKMNSLAHFYQGIVQVNVDAGVTTHHHQKGEIFYAEVNLHIPGRMIRVVKEEQDLYKAIDKVKDHLKVELETMKEKARRRDKQELRDVKQYVEE